MCNSDTLEEIQRGNFLTETKLIEYIITIVKHKSTSKAADELYPTQLALNQQLLKLERELGAPLLARTRNHWESTGIGKPHEERSGQILEIKNQIYNQVQDMVKKWKGTTTIGLTPERGIQILTAIHPIIHVQYPDTTFQSIEANVESQLRMMDARETDISFQTTSERKYEYLVYEIIFCRPLYLRVPKTHPLAYRESLELSQYPEISLK